MQNSLGFLKNRKWHKMRKWKEPALMAECVTSAIVDPALAKILPFCPTVYVDAQHMEFVPEDEFEMQVKKTERLLRGSPKIISHRFKTGDRIEVNAGRGVVRKL